ncbi:MAG TPA: ABC transporter substrate-binding protein [Geminicoccaceae bacterium]|nr:ABC transporter substrate-binding protein [Geminicoccus sp.]HMU49393.1 ABC transporter substrate-binding protein [Geminicoccaceae bacterium]
MRARAVHLSVLLASAALMALPAMAGPPDKPRVIADIPELGKPGGEMRMLISRDREIRFFNIYGYARLIAYTPDLKLAPDILEAFEDEDGKVFTFHLRPGHRWSDGEPFTAEDFRFYWEDIALDKELSFVGPDIRLSVDDELPKLEVLDELTVRFSWSRPNRFFIPSLASTNQLFMYRPAHYLKKFHKKYAEPAELERLVKENGARNWVQLFLRKDRLDNFDDPAMPTLQPWMLTSGPPGQRYVASRNPYFHRVDSAGHQLPYIDRFVLELVDGKLIPAKTGAGETDIQPRKIAFRDYTFLRDSEARTGIKVLLWPEARASHFAIYPNMNAKDPEWRRLFRDLRFRKAVSIGLDRDELNQFLYSGLGQPANNTVQPQSPLWSEEVAGECTAYDPDAANRLLDELGLDKRNEQGVRLLPDGRPLELVIESAGEEVEEVDTLEIVANQWAKIGFRVHSKPSDRQVLRNRMFSGDGLMAIGFGIDNGVPTPEQPPSSYAPTNQAEQLQWPKWGQYYETRGAAGEPPDLPEAQRLMELFNNWKSATSDEQTTIWQEMLRIYAPQCYTIGLVGEVQQPIAVRGTMRNVPENALYNWDPHAHIGIYLPDTFWYAE